MDAAVFLHGSLCVCFCSGWWGLQLSCQMEPHLVQLLPRGRGKLCHLVLHKHWQSWYSWPGCTDEGLCWLDEICSCVHEISVTLAVAVVSVPCQRADALPEALQHSGKYWEIAFLSRCQVRWVANSFGSTNTDTSAEYRLISGLSTLLKLMKFVLIPQHRYQTPVVYVCIWEFS